MYASRQVVLFNNGHRIMHPLSVLSYDKPIYESRFFLPSTDQGKWATGTSKKLFSLLSRPASAQYQAVNAANRPSQRVSAPLSIY